MKNGLQEESWYLKQAIRRKTPTDLSSRGGKLQRTFHSIKGIFFLSELLKYECAIALSTDRGFEELFKRFLQISHIFGAGSLIRGVHR